MFANAPNNKRVLPLTIAPQDGTNTCNNKRVLPLTNKRVLPRTNTRRNQGVMPPTSCPHKRAIEEQLASRARDSPERAVPTDRALTMLEKMAYEGKPT